MGARAAFQNGYRNSLSGPAGLDAAWECYIETAENSTALPEHTTVTVIKVIMNQAMQELDGDIRGVAAYEK